MMATQKHKIQLVGLIGDKQKEKLILLGFIFIEDKKQVVFNPCFKGSRGMHWTLHEDGKLHMKDSAGKVIFECKRQPLSSFKGQSQMVSTCSTFESDLNSWLLEYKKVATSQIFAVDLRNYKKMFNLSIHICSYNQILKCSKIFSKYAGHQAFIYLKSKPYLVVQIFEPTS